MSWRHILSASSRRNERFNKTLTFSSALTFLQSIALCFGLGVVLHAGEAQITPQWSSSGSAIQGGWENGGNPTLPVCRTIDPNGTMRPGKLVNGNCNITENGVELSGQSQGVLVDPGGALYSWEGVNDGKPNGWKRFYDGMSDGPPLFVCRAKHRENLVLERGVHPGELGGLECRYGYGNAVHIVKDDEFTEVGAYFNSPYEVLYVPRQGSVALSDFARSNPLGR